CCQLLTEIRTYTAADPSFVECVVTGDIYEYLEGENEFGQQSFRTFRMTKRFFVHNVDGPALLSPFDRHLQLQRQQERQGGRLPPTPDGSPSPEKSRRASERMASDASGAVGGADAFVYMGGGGPEVPMNAVRVRVDPSVVSIPADAFRCRGKLEEVELHEGLRGIGENAFFRCVGLRRIRIPASVQTISRCAFRGCKKLERVELSEGLRVIGVSAFVGCFNLRHINLPSTLKRIDTRAFSNTSSSLFSINLPDGLEHLEMCAFQNSTLDHVDRTTIVLQM
ncbi:hypothetical protein ACHAWF_000710, partial [Thalassiosira exigua]